MTVENGKDERNIQGEKSNTSASHQEQQMLESERLPLQMLIDNIPDLIYQKDREGRFVFVNRSFANAVGLRDAKDIVGKTDREVFPKEIAEKFITDDRMVIETAQLMDNIEEPVVSASGSLRWLLTTKVPLLDKTGRAAGLIGISRDITLRKELEKKNQLLATLVESADDAIMSMDLNHRITSWNTGAERLYGYEAEEMIGGLPSRIVPRDLQDETRRNQEQVHNNGQVMRHETTRLRKDGSPINVSVTISAIRDAEGRIVGNTAVARDITDRKKAEEATRKGEERYRLLFNSISDAAFVHGITADGLPGRITEVNDIACERWGYTRDELLRMSPLDLDVPEAAARAPQIVARLMAEKHAVWESIFVSKTGQRIPVEISNHLFDMGGEPTILSSVRDITKRKQLEENLEHERTLLLTLINNLPDYIYMKDRGSRFILANKALAELLGSGDPKELIGRTDHDFSPKEIADRYRADDRRVMESGKGAASFEEPSQSAAGDTRSLLTTKLPIFDNAGAVTGLVGISRDITERKRAEEALRESEFRLTRAEKVAKTGNWQLDLDTKQIIASPGASIIYGVEEQKRSLEDIQRLPLPEYRNMLNKALADLIARNIPYDHEFKIQRMSDGKIIDIHSIAEYEKDSNTVYGVIQDITERKQAEERIQDLARFPDENPNPVMRVSTNGLILYQNPASRTFLPSWTGTQGNTISAEHLPAILRTWATGETQEIEVRESKRVFILTIAPILMRGYIDLYARDVTEEKALYEKLLQAQKMEAIGRLGGGVAHDFNNLLTVISGYCELAKQQLNEGSSVRTHVDAIAEAADRAATLTTQLLAFSRKQVLLPRVVNLNSLVKNIEKILARLVGEDIEIKTFLQPDAGDVKADPGQIEQVLMNLVVNARDAMPDGGKLTIETSNRILDDEYAVEHPGALAGEYVRVSVSDTGEGMDQEVLSHIFEPFFTTKEQGKGTGLGLATVYGIVKQSGGYITCYSELGKGTTFTIYFPRTAETRQSTTAHIERLSALHGSETILLVEDEERVRRFTQMVLESNGYTVIAAPNGNQALGFVESKKCEIALLVTDVVMPNMSGKELAQRLLLAYPRARVLFVSGYTGNVIVHHGVLDPGINFLQKPFKSRELLEKVREILDRL